MPQPVAGSNLCAMGTVILSFQERVNRLLQYSRDSLNFGSVMQQLTAKHSWKEVLH